MPTTFAQDPKTGYWRVKRSGQVMFQSLEKEPADRFLKHYLNTPMLEFNKLYRLADNPDGGQYVDINTPPKLPTKEYGNW